MAVILLSKDRISMSPHRTPNTLPAARVFIGQMSFTAHFRAHQLNLPGRAMMMVVVVLMVVANQKIE